MKRLQIIFFAWLLYLCCSPLFATTLPLTHGEVQRLKNYFPQNADTHLMWQGDPMTILLPLHQEKRLVFSDRIRVNVNGSLTTDQCRMINDDHSLYITAQKDFPLTRIYVTLEKTGRVLLIDLVPSTEATNTTLTIQDADNSIPAATTTASSENVSTPLQEDPSIELVRFAWQQLYAPRWLLANFPDFQRVPMGTTPFVDNLVYGDQVIAHPVFSFEHDHTYVTAVTLRNKYAHPAHIFLNRDLCGSWKAATLYPRATLAPAGDKTSDTTTLFLISESPFNHSMELCHGNA